MPDSPTRSDADASLHGVWRDELLTRLGFVLFGLGMLIVPYAASRGWSPAHLLALVVLPASAGVSAAFGERLGLRRRGALLVGSLLFFGAISAFMGGPSPATVLAPLLAAVVAALVFGRRAALLTLLAGAASMLVPGAATRQDIAASWAADLVEASTWARLAVVFLLLGSLVVLLVATAVRRAEANAGRLQQAEARARANEELFRAIVQDQTEMIVRWRPDGTRTFVNQAYCRVFGKSEQELVGTSFMPDVAEQDRAAIIRKLQGITPEHPVAVDTHESITASGEHRWQEWTDRGIFDADGKLVELQSTGRDVTDALVAQAALEDSEVRYRLLFDGNPMPMLVYELSNQRFVAVNDASVRQYGYSREELLRMSVGDLALPGDPHYQTFLDELGRGRPPVVHVGLRQQKRRDGSVIDVDMTSLEVPFGGRSARLTMARDVTAEREAQAERARLQAAVEQAATEWQRTFDAVEQPLVVFDTDLRVVRLNRRAAAMVAGPSDGEVRGRHASEIGTREPWLTAARLLAQAAASDGACSAEARDSDSGCAWTLTVSRAPVGAEGEPRLILVATEVSRLIELQESLRRSETMAAMGGIVAGVAHEVRNALFGISATLDALENHRGSEPRYEPFASVLRSQLARLQQLTRDLLDYGKPPALRLSEVRVEQLVGLAVKSCDAVAREHAVRVEQEIASGLPALRVDAGRIQQVVENLVSNAIQHSPRRGLVRVIAQPAAGASRGGICLVVEDEGPGVDADDVEHLFEPFYSKRTGGTGLGLSIVRRIVEAHGGQVEIDNAERGARFRVSLPLVREEA
jgi:PAS domain S-box-containing protein